MIYAKETEKKILFLKGMGIMFLISAVFFIAYSLILTNINNNKAKQLLAKQASESIQVDVLVKKVKQGATIAKSDYITINCPKKYVSENPVSTNIVGKISRIDLNSNTQVLTSMLSDIDNVTSADLRNQDYSDIVLNKNIKIGDYVDIREKNKDGSDYIVVSKKKVLAFNNNTLIMNILEIERQFKNNATVDASLTGGILYTTIYTDPENQPAATVTYHLNGDIDKLINNNPNVVKDASKNLSDNINKTTTTKPTSATSTN